jgi:hypothetical protein
LEEDEEEETPLVKFAGVWNVIFEFEVLRTDEGKAIEK